ncbi:hypothetical protein ACJVC5_18325 [Peredibacter sp. HCB2-198]|uniref:hypothetical protein n=1 Tax=Peredibacter sp. HCB2-198 TaxID=3383025 RepID=UPI0038B5F8B3
MSDLDKKFKISELPDEGSSSSPKPPKKTVLKKDPDPRVERLQLLSEREKVEVMTQTWVFDKRVRSFGWVPFVLVLIGLQVSTPYKAYLAEIQLLDENTMGLFGGVLREFTQYLEFLVRNPVILALLTPLFFKFTRVSDYYFEVTFDGLKTVKKVLEHGSKELVTRVYVKWKDITGVEKRTVNNREVLVILTPDGATGELIWDIELGKKKAIKQLLNGLINNKHPLRVFLENEKELK